MRYKIKLFLGRNLLVDRIVPAPAEGATSWQLWAFGPRVTIEGLVLREGRDVQDPRYTATVYPVVE